MIGGGAHDPLHDPGGDPCHTCQDNCVFCGQNQAAQRPSEAAKKSPTPKRKLLGL